jgi:hypothetical protein
MKMKTERGRRKVGRRLGLPEVEQKQAVRRVSLTRPVRREGLERRPDEEAPRPPDDEQS